MSRVSVVCCQGDLCEGQTLVQTSPTDCVFLNGYDVETSTMKRPRAASAVRTRKTKCNFCINVKSISIQITDVGVTDVSHAIYDTFLCINLNESK